MARDERLKGSQFSFNAGEFSPEMEGRTDLAKYGSSCRTLKNFIPRISGPARKRPGTRWVNEVKDSADNARLIPFEFSDTQAYVLEFGDLYFRVKMNGGTVLESAKVITGLDNLSPRTVVIAGHGYANGDTVYITGTSTDLDGRYWVVGNQGPNSFELVGSVVGTAWAAGGTAARVYTVTTTYAHTDLAGLQFVQSADTLYIAHRDYPPRKITRTGHTSWTITTIAFSWPAFRPENADDTILVYASAVSGAVTLTASSGIFSASHVGSVFKLREQVASNNVIWEASTALQWNNSSLSVGEYAQYNGNVYELQDKHGAGSTSRTPPVHTLEGQERTDGNWDWIYRHSGEGYVTITGFTNSTIVTGTVTSHRLPASVVGFANRTALWSFGAWDVVQGYPRALTFYEDRLWFAGTDTDPQTIWGSVLGDYENHRTLPTDASGLVFTISDDEVNVINWIRGLRALMIGTQGGVFIGTGSDPEKPISPSNTLKIPKHSDEAAEPGNPVPVGNALLYSSRTGRTLLELTYDFGTDAYQANELSLLADHLLVAGGIAEMAHQHRPDHVFWIVTGDGKLLGVSYDRGQDVVGWHQHPIGGSFSGGEAVVESIAIIPHPDGDQEQVWLVVKRTINSATKRYIEVMEKPISRTAALEDAYYVDSGLTYDSAPTTTINGLWHLIGESVYAWADGVRQGPFTVSAGGAITITSASVVQAGYSYNSDLALQAPEAESSDGSLQGRLKQQTGIVFRLDRTGRGLFYGPDSSNLEELPWTADQDPLGTTLTIFSGDTREMPFPGNTESRGTVYVRHSYPSPCTILSIMPRFVVLE